MLHRGLGLKVVDLLRDFLWISYVILSLPIDVLTRQSLSFSMLFRVCREASCILLKLHQLRVARYNQKFRLKPK